MTQKLTPKKSTETVLYVFDFQDQIPGDGITSYVLAVASGTVVLTQERNEALSVSCLISGGADGVTQELTLQITTALGQIINRDITLLIDDGAIVRTPETTTKRAIIEIAFEEMTLANYEFNTTAEEYATALRRLDILCGELQGPGNGIRLNYNFPVTVGGGDLNDESGIPDFGINAIGIKLALRLAPAIGKSLSQESKTALFEGMNALRAALTTIPNRQLPSRTARGAGNKPWTTWNPFGWAGSGGA